MNQEGKKKILKEREKGKKVAFTNQSKHPKPTSVSTMKKKEKTVLLLLLLLLADHQVLMIILVSLL